MIIWIVLFILVIGLAIVFFVPYSPIRKKYETDLLDLIVNNQLQEKGLVFKEEDFLHLPKCVQNYMKYCGYIGKKQMNYVTLIYNQVNFKMDKNKPELKMTYRQCNFANQPSRIAIMSTKMFGIPFEGYDYYRNNNGGMLGMLGKLFTLFHQTGKEMDKACLVTYLAESLFIPTTLLQNNIEFKELSPYEMKATIRNEDLMVSGIFTFNTNYEMISFSTHDRAITNEDGTMENVLWSAHCSAYETTDTGIKLPKNFQAVWHYPNEDFVYFQGEISEVFYG